MYVRFVFCDYLEKIKKTLYGNLTLTICMAVLPIICILIIIIKTDDKVSSLATTHPSSPLPPSPSRPLFRWTTSN